MPTVVIERDRITPSDALSAALGTPDRVILTAHPGGALALQNGDAGRAPSVQKLLAMGARLFRRQPDMAFARRHADNDRSWYFYMKLGKLRALEPGAYRAEEQLSGFTLLSEGSDLAKGEALWTGELGREYTERNARNDREKLVPGFKRLIEGLEIARVLEVGCNAGHNLHALKRLLPDAKLVGLDPYEPALELARKQNVPAELHVGTMLDLPFPDDSFDLVFTRGVMSTIPNADFDRGLAELHRVSRRYVALVEYHPDEGAKILYFGRDDIVHRRDYVALSREQFPHARVIRDEPTQDAGALVQLHTWVFDISTGSRVA
ncbi:MAG: methyltransferase domain-containing protein [Microthrixaceae bacterium]